MNRPATQNLLADQIANREQITEAMGRAVRQALREHKKAGNPVAIWEDGKVVWVAPEDIVLPPESEDMLLESETEHTTPEGETHS